jgi:hypothetical protein
MGRATRSTITPLEMGAWLDGRLYLLGWTAIFVTQLPMYLTTGMGVPIQLAADAAPLRRPCDVHLKHTWGEAPIVLYACSS